LNSKLVLRQQLKQRRQTFTPVQWSQVSAQVCAQLQTLDQFQVASQILSYVPLPQEIDLSALFALPKIWGIPRCIKDGALTWHHYDPQQLTQGKYGIKEPLASAPQLDPAQSDLVLVPTLGCDRQGYRLGYGGGYYDRFFANYPLPNLGVMSSLGWVTDFPIEPWDQRLQGVVTEEGVCWFA